MIALIPLFAIIAAAVILGILVVTRKSADSHEEHDDHDGGGHHAEPFTIFGHAPLFYVALAGVFGATWYFGPGWFPSMDIWILEGIAVGVLYLAWAPVYEKILSIKASVTGGHHHPHVAHGDDEADTLGLFLFAAAGSYGISVVWAMLDHCASDTRCSVFNLFWLRLGEVSARWLHCPGNWILIIAFAMQSRFFKSRLPGYVMLGIWIFTVMPYVDAGYNADPWDEVWRLSGHNPAWLLQWLFPVTFG